LRSLKQSIQADFDTQSGFLQLTNVITYEIVYNTSKPYLPLGEMGDLGFR
jgi:hypothetical protein